MLTPAFERAKALAADQHGIVTRRDAELCGMSETEIRRMVRGGRWTRMHRGVFATNHPAEPGLLTEIVAARFAARGGVVAGHSAARLWNLEGARAERPELVLRPEDTREQRPGIRLSWRALGADEIIELAGVPTTTVARTLLDLVRREPLQVALPLVDSALNKGLLPQSSLSELAAAARRRPQAFLLADGRAESVFESLARLSLVRSGLVPEELQLDVYDEAGGWLGRVDMAWPSRRLLVELDGFATHGSPEALRADLQRQNALVAAGWTILRFTWRDRERIPATVRAALML